MTGIDSTCQRMPEIKAWSGRSHEAAAEMFGRASRDASTFSEYANAVASALKNGSGTIGSTRTALLNKADQVDQGELNVTDQWVVLIDPVRMSADKLAQPQALAQEQQAPSTPCLPPSVTLTTRPRMRWWPPGAGSASWRRDP
ncbi:hypothetical protein [Mycolicibacterium moriokaense]|uniref:hypothetical protein n=1 Tax=Mycolicibacterium moriokaense TaxID=39691 RepID=UPI001F4773DF|nr:hypothetical protein [Mycolicibacterium moriokaense]